MEVNNYNWFNSRGYPIFPSTIQNVEGREDRVQRIKNRKAIKIVLGVAVVVAMFFGVYTQLPGTVVFNEYGLATSYFEHATGPVISAQNFAYYYFYPFSGSTGNVVQSAVNAIYASGIGYIFNGLADILTAAGMPVSGPALVILGATAMGAVLLGWGLAQTAAAMTAYLAAAGIVGVTVEVSLAGLLTAYVLPFAAVVGAL